MSNAVETKSVGWRIGDVLWVFALIVIMISVFFTGLSPFSDKDPAEEEGYDD